MNQSTPAGQSAPSPAAKRLLAELNSGFGRSGNDLIPFKEIVSAHLVTTSFDHVKAEVIGYVEVETLKQTYTDSNLPINERYSSSRARERFRISLEDARLLAEAAPKEFLESFRKAVDTLERDYAARLPAIEARRQKRLADIEKGMSATIRPVEAPARALFKKNKAPAP